MSQKAMEVFPLPISYGMILILAVITCLSEQNRTKWVIKMFTITFQLVSRKAYQFSGDNYWVFI